MLIFPRLLEDFLPKISIHMKSIHGLLAFMWSASRISKEKKCKFGNTSRIIWCFTWILHRGAMNTMKQFADNKPKGQISKRVFHTCWDSPMCLITGELQ